MDIRKYFGGGGSSSAPKPSGDGDAAPSKKPKKKEETKPSSTPAASPPAKSPKKPTPKSAANQPSSASKRQKTAPGSSAKKPPAPKKKEEDGVVDLVDSEFEVDLEDSESESDSDAGFVVEDDDDVMEIEEVEPTKKDTAAGNKRKSTSATPKAATKPRKTTAAPKGSGGKSKLPAALIAIQNNPAAMAAVAAVDKAAESLPPEDQLGMTLLSETAFGGKAPDEPANLGEKELPRGHPDCLTGKIFVISGVLDSITRDQAEDLIKRHGGKVTSAVSGRTSFLIVGQHTGRTKYHTAKTNNTKMINEDGLFSLIAAAPEPKEEEEQEVPAAVPAVGGAAVPAGPSTVSAAKFHSAGDGTSQAAAGLGAARGAGVSQRPADDGQLWVEKWRPRTSGELVGNQATVNQLRQWLKDWEHVHLKGGEPNLPANVKKDRMADFKKKAVLLAGSPGIGKTSAALIISRELGYEPVEVNASDTRSKADASVLKGVGGKVANSVKELTTNAAMSFGGAAGKAKKLVLIMDEVDGMSAGDRGGVADLIKTIAKSKIPIIAICNDKYSQKLRSLRNHCMMLDFKKPMVQQIAKRMMEIAAKEGLAINQSTMEALVQSANGGDIRLILGQLQMVRLRARSLTYDQVKSGGAGTAKDLEMSPFEAARRLLDSDACSGLSLADQIELVFQDADLVPLLVQENYLNHRPRIAANDSARMACIAKAAEGFSAGDVANRSVRQYQNWALMPFAAAMGTVNPATYCRGARETFGLYPTEQNFPRFTMWLGNNSSQGKQKRLLGELHTRMLSSEAVECDRTAVRLSYLPVLRTALTKPLVEKGKEGIPEVLELMKDYCISREDYDFITSVTSFKTKAPWGADPYKPIETAVKTAFTRAFNAQHLMPKTGFAMEEGKKKKGKGKGSAAAAGDEEDDEENGLNGGGEGENEAAGVKVEEEEEEELDPVMLRKKLMGMKHAGMSVTLKDGTAAPKSGKGSRRGGRGSRGGGKASGSGTTGRGRGRGKK